MKMLFLVSRLRSLNVIAFSSPVSVFTRRIPSLLVPLSSQSWTDKRTPLRTYSATSGSKTASDVVYRGNLTTLIKATKLFSLSSSVAGLGAQPLLFAAAQSMPPAVVASVGVVVAFFTFVTPFILHWITKKYVTEMRYEPRSRTFTATTLNFFIVPRTLHFRASDVHVPDVLGPFTTFMAKNKPLFVDFRRFEDIDAFRHLMGYDKPIDLKLNDKPD